MLRSVLTHAVLLGLAGCLAWTARTAPADEAAQQAAIPKTALVAASEGQVSRVIFSKEDETIALVALEDRHGRWWSGTITTTKSPEQDGGEPTVEEERFQAGKSAERLFERLEPLEVERVLEGVADTKLEELGLREPGSSVEVILADGTSHRLELGGRVFGTRDVYARLADGRVAILPSALVRDLDAGKGRLLERTLLSKRRNQIRTLRLQMGERATTLTQANPKSPKDATWTASAGGPDPTAEVEPAAAWKALVGKLLRLRALSWHDVDGVPSGAPTGWEPVLTLEVTDLDGGGESFTLSRAPGDTPATSAQTLWYVRGDHARLAAKVSPQAADDLIGDLEQLLP